eukprot:5294729-Amphidinium_carterae.1
MYRCKCPRWVRCKFKHKLDPHTSPASPQQRSSRCYGEPAPRCHQMRCWQAGEMQSLRLARATHQRGQVSHIYAPLASAAGTSSEGGLFRKSRCSKSR